MDKVLDATLKQLEDMRLRNIKNLETEKRNKEAEEKRRLLELEKEAFENLKSQLLDIDTFSKRESTAEATKKRIAKAKNDFKYFDKGYFPPSFYGDDFATPGKFHFDICDIADSTDKKVHLILGPRDHAKTAMLQKKFLWKFLFGKHQFMAIGSETLDTPESYISDLLYYLNYNDRLLHDFKLKWHEASTKKLFATSQVNPKGTFVQTLSEEKSSRGKRRLQRRFGFILLTDYENYTSSLTSDALRKRRNRLNEMRGSLAKGGTLVWEANNFDTDCLANQFLKEQDEGNGAESVEVHVYPAWDDNRPYTQRALWSSRFPANSEEELREMLVVEDDYDWLGNFQQRPEPRSGEIFPRENYKEWKELPSDIQSVIFVDPNTSEKGKGDTTGMPNLGFSPSTKLFYITAGRCRSYFLSNDLLKDLLVLHKEESEKGIAIITIGMDGNVTQESVWKNNIYNFVSLNGFAFPHIQFKKYHVDLLVTNLESLWKQNKIFFPPNFGKTEEGARALKQVFRFNFKKANKKDDFPDALISAYTLLIELGISFVVDQTPQMHSVNNYRVKRI